MKKKITKKQLFVGIILVIIVIVLGVLVINLTKPKESKVEDSIKTAEIAGLKIDKVKITADKEQSVYEADITNTTDSISKHEAIDIILKDKNGDVIITLLGYIGKETKANETKHIKAATSMKITEDQVKKIEYKIHEEPINTEK